LKKILIPASGEYTYRNFIASKAFEELEKFFEVIYVVTPELKDRIEMPKVEVVEIGDEQIRSNVRQYLGFLTMMRYRKRSPTFPLKYKNLFWDVISKKNKFRSFFLSLPIICELYVYARELILGERSDFAQVLKKVDPDLVLIPTNYADSFSVDWLKVARSLNYKSFWLMFNWDNPSCKGVMPWLPTYFGVWGEQTMEQVVRIHRAKKSSVFILGCPQFEVYTKPLSDRPDFYLEELRNKIAPDARIFLIAGVSRYRDEMTLLNLLDGLVVSGQLRNVQFIYRPHPSKVIAKGEKNFFDFSFKHIILDPQVEDHYKRCFNQANYKWKGFAPSYDYYPKLLSIVDGVISSMSTMAIESLMMGKPVLLTSYPDQIFNYSFDKLSQYDHHNCWQRIENIVNCQDFENLAACMEELVKVSEQEGIEDQLKESVKYVVYHDKRDYSMRLLDVVKNLV
jgi:hypothetical protein